MNTVTNRGALFKKILGYFLQGLIVIAPVGLTIYVIYGLVTSVDSWIPIFREKVYNPDGTQVIGYKIKNYGLGFLLVVITVILVGYLSSFFLKSRIFAMFDRWMEKTPGIKFIYSTSKDMFGAFAGNKKKFDKPVLVAIENEEVYRVGFITESDLKEFGLATHVAVYVPAAYSISGYVYLVPFYRVKKVDGVSAADAMKFAISGGVSDVDDELEHEPKRLKEKE
jgi:uncharacterized membrane protein